jgi:hypothetical protein
MSVVSVLTIFSSSFLVRDDPSCADLLLNASDEENKLSLCEGEVEMWRISFHSVRVRWTSLMICQVPNLICFQLLIIQVSYN